MLGLTGVPFKRTSRNRNEVSDLPDDLITVFCSFCTRECVRVPFKVAVYPWESAHNDVLPSVNPDAAKLVQYRGYKLAGRPVCVGCYKAEMGQLPPGDVA